MTYQEFVTQVQRRARLHSYEEAEEATRQVMLSLAQVLPKGEARKLDGAIPAEISDILARGPDAPDCLIDQNVFMGWLMNRAETFGLADRTLGGYDAEPINAAEEVSRRITAVLGVFKSQLTREQRKQLANMLPVDLRQWLQSA